MEIVISKLFSFTLIGTAAATSIADAPVSFSFKVNENVFTGSGYFVETAIANCLQQAETSVAPSTEWSSMRIGGLNFISIAGIYDIPLEVYVKKGQNQFSASVIFNGISASAEAENIITATSLALVEYRRKREASKPPKDQ